MVWLESVRIFSLNDFDALVVLVNRYAIFAVDGSELDQTTLAIREGELDNSFVWHRIIISYAFGDHSGLFHGVNLSPVTMRPGARVGLE